jgi:GT2 family glycosyltransferase
LKHVSIIIPCYNQLKYTQLCLESIWSFTHCPYELIIVDNGSDDGTGSWVEHNCACRIIKNEKNLGAPTAFNQGVEVSSGKYILFLNNDTIVSDGWLGRLVEKTQINKNIAIVGPCTNIRVYEPSEGEINRTAAAVSLRNKGRYKEVPGITSFCMLVKKRVIDEIGGFDKNYGMGTNDDHDFCLRARIAGYKIICALDTFVFHFYNKTLGNLDIAELDRKNREYFAAKFGQRAIHYLNEINQPYGTRGENFNCIPDNSRL